MLPNDPVKLPRCTEPFVVEADLGILLPSPSLQEEEGEQTGAPEQGNAEDHVVNNCSCVIQLTQCVQ